MKIRYLTIILSLMLILTACAKDSTVSKNSETNPGSFNDEIRVGLDVDPETMDPRLASNTSAKRVAEVVFDGLVRLNSNLEPEPALAESWEHPDDLTWIFHLRKGVTFHDGTPLTANDVKFTYDTLLNEKFNSPSRGLYTPIKSVEVIDKLTVKFNLSQPYTPLLSYLDLGIVPASSANNKNFANKPIGTGPYKVVSWSKNNYIKFEANENYWNGKPKTKKLTYFIIPDNTTRVAALEAGDVDFVHSPLSPQDIERMKKDDRFVVKETNGLGFTYLNFNQKNEILSDKKVRQAIAHLINKQSISKDIYQGMDKKGTSPIIPSSWAYSDKVTDYPYDPKKAVQLLNEAGWKDSDGDGVLDKNGKKLNIELSTHTEDPNRIQSVEYLQHEWSSVGIDVKVTTTEWPTFSERLMNNDFDIALVGWLNLVDPDRAMYNQFHTNGVTNYGKYSNPRVDELLEKGRTISDQNERAKIYQETAQIVNDDVAYSVLLYQGYYAIYNKKLQGFEIHPSGQLTGLYKATLSN
jgi:peptide/nickel transport system substrate-binding protein